MADTLDGAGEFPLVSQFRLLLDSLPADVAASICLSGLDYLSGGDWFPRLGVYDGEYLRVRGVTFRRRGGYWSAVKQVRGIRREVYVGRLLDGPAIAAAIARLLGGD